MTANEPRFACVHGHFYQLPRENPWLEAVEVEDSAAPYHDWNQRIAAECYAANAAARLQTSEGRLTAIVCNYERMSFNFGPTLLTWMEKADAATYRAILEADRASVLRLGGHGNAIAQAYNHVILPLASPRDRATQIRWGKADFLRRFGREPEAMWLAETAVDAPTLEALAKEGMRFAILSPRQAEAVAPLDGDEWTAVDEHLLDAAQAYRCELPSGRSIALFFYDGQLAQAIAFGGLLYDGGAFAGRLFDLAAPAAGDDGPRLAHVATDGESYGHHHRFGEMALAYALRRLEEAGIEPTNYGRYLELSPPRRRVRIRENSSWSCFHGVERWRADCGCKTGGPAHWSQAWRGALRKGLDELKERLDAIFETHGGRVLADPWAARDAYVRVVLDRSPGNVDAFLAEHGKGPLDEAGQVAALRSLEMQRAGMLMFTSCGWFFDDMAGLESVQVMKYACRAARLGHALSGEDARGTPGAFAGRGQQQPAGGRGRGIDLPPPRAAAGRGPAAGRGAPRHHGDVRRDRSGRARSVRVQRPAPGGLVGRARRDAAGHGALPGDFAPHARLGRGGAGHAALRRARSALRRACGRLGRDVSGAPARAVRDLRPAFAVRRGDGAGEPLLG